MITSRRWRVDIYVDEHDDDRTTHAEARALSDLAHKLLHAAASDIEVITHQRVHLHS
ncbi:dsRBD fold-containing protein [Kribbella sp. NPDC048928]|uniref:dsRBD fold-containing protein n=1 Tax=Kribbella sp. NPDC048928 TaxID=3364111 RepID=UPI003714D061